MIFWLAVFYGAVQGLTEFLPISSSGHLAIAALLVGEGGQDNVAFFLLLHLATFIAVCLVYWKDIWTLLQELFLFIPQTIRKRPSKNPETKRLLGLLILSLLPLFLVLPFKSRIEAAFDNPFVIGGALICTAILLFFANRMKNTTKTVAEITLKDALIIGFAQMFAVIPGLSRSGTTLAVGLFCGLERETAVKYSFILSLPTILGAVVLDYKEIFTLAHQNLGPYLIGFVTAGLLGYAAIGLVRFLSRKGRLNVFSVYCGIVGTALIVSRLV